MSKFTPAAVNLSIGFYPDEEKELKAIQSYLYVCIVSFIDNIF